jgi:nucleoid-associated protein YgaU
MMNWRVLSTQYLVPSKWRELRTWLLSLLIVSVFGTRYEVLAAFEDTGTGARPTVMGGTYVAAGDDVQSLMYNPAGLAQLHQHELTSEYSRLYAGLTDGSNLGQYFLGYGQPIKYGGTIAAGWKQMSLDNLYTERTLSLGYGEWITSRIAAGLALKQLHHSFGAPSYSVDDNGNITNNQPSFFQQYGNASTAYSMDLGFLLRYTDRDTLGFSIQDLNEPNVALNPADHEIVPRTIRAGVAHQGRKGLTLAGSLTSREGLANQQDYTWTGAVEKWWTMKDDNAFAARGSLATGSRSFQQMAMGASYRFNPYQVDYAFVFNLNGVALGNTAGTHRFSFSYRFGKEEKERTLLGSKPGEKKAHRAERKVSVNEIPELEEMPAGQAGMPKTSAPAPVAGEYVVRKTESANRSTGAPANTSEGVSPTRPLAVSPAQAVPEEVSETAQMMKSAPVVPVEAPQKGPGLDVTVPAAAPEPTVENVKVAPNLVVTKQPAEEEATLEIRQVTRTQLLEWTDKMVSSYNERLAAQAPAEHRLAAFKPLYPVLQSYVEEEGGELLDQLDLGDELARSAKQYDKLVWEGASAQERLNHLEKTLEQTLVPALKNRVWDPKDLRDKRYKAWLDQALAKGRAMIDQGAKTHTRMVYWGGVAQKALKFERMPKEPVQIQPVIPVVKPVPTVKPVAPVVSPVKPKKPVAEQGIGRPLGEGEWLYKVKEGDTLLSLANTYFGDYNRWRDIYILNEDRLGRGGALRVGQLIVMPKK